MSTAVGLGIAADGQGLRKVGGGLHKQRNFTAEHTETAEFFKFLCVIGSLRGEMYTSSQDIPDIMQAVVDDKNTLVPKAIYATNKKLPYTLNVRGNFSYRASFASRPALTPGHSRSRML